MRRHNCGRTANGVDWSVCSACEGRIHLDGCTSRRDRMRDCCAARHAMLWAAGEKLGRNDASQPMYDTSNRTWAD